MAEAFSIWHTFNWRHFLGFFFCFAEVECWTEALGVPNLLGNVIHCLSVCRPGLNWVLQWEQLNPRMSLRIQWYKEVLVEFWVLQPCPAGAGREWVGESRHQLGHWRGPLGSLRHCPAWGEQQQEPLQSVPALAPALGCSLCRHCSLGEGLMDEPNLNKSLLQEKPHLEVPSCVKMLRVWRARVYQKLWGSAGRFCYRNTVPIFMGAWPWREGSALHRDHDISKSHSWSFPLVHLCRHSQAGSTLCWDRTVADKK